MTTHTPAPWHVTRYNDLQYSISNHEDGYEEQYINDTEDDANARLIAAAPELLEALEPLADWAGTIYTDQNDDDFKTICLTIGQIRAAAEAIAKAKGE